ncbi:MAG: DEAD/DEAH box helicase family protein [Thermomicrobiales bacterium]
MPPTDVTEHGLETLIVDRLTGRIAPTSGAAGGVQDARAAYHAGGYVEGTPADYDRAHALDVVQLLRFLHLTQPQVVEALELAEDGPARRKFFDRLQGQITKNGVVEVLRKGVPTGPHHVTLYYPTPTPGNALAAIQHGQNIFSVTRQLRYSLDETARALDMVIFINGLPVITFELKNSFTHQNAADAVAQYKQDRNPRELIFQPKRCLVHFAVDDQDVQMCARLQGAESWFLPFNKGHHDGKGNPPNPHGVKTAYLWEELLTRESLSNIIENYAQVVIEKDDKGKKRERVIFPRYHQLHAVRAVLAHAAQHGAGQRYLIQHSAGSGKSNSIAWLAHQLVNLQEAPGGPPTFDTVVVVTDRRVLDKQIRDTIKSFHHVGATVGAAERSGQLREFIREGKRIVISTIQKFPMILDEIGNDHRGRRFAIIIDEAHSSQGGKSTAALGGVLGPGEQDESETYEETINRVMEARQFLPNASYFAFTATPKNRTLELFGRRLPDDPPRFVPFHSYTMKQAIQEGFILDVLAHYTPVKSYYKLVTTLEADPEVDTRQAGKKLRAFVENHSHAIGEKAEIMVDHFLANVLGQHKIGGQARAMVVTDGVPRAIAYWEAINAYLGELGKPYRALVAFSGERDYHGQQVTEADLNHFPSAEIPERFREDANNRFLVVADKFQTGYDEPLLHTMYVDKQLRDIKAVQTLSRLNRAHGKKHDTSVLDFHNDPEEIAAAFAPYYRTTILSGETDPDKLHDLKATLEDSEVYTPEQVETVAQRFITNAPRPTLDAVLDRCRDAYEALDTEEQITFKGTARLYTRAYAFLATLLPYTNASWEALSIFLNLLIPRLPTPGEGEDDELSQEILDAIDLDSYRAEVRAATEIPLPDNDGEVTPAPTSGAGSITERETELLSQILQQFNDIWGNYAWTDADKVAQAIAHDLPEMVSADVPYANAQRNSDKQNARVEFERALQQAVTGLVSIHTDLYKQFAEDESFRSWLSDRIFNATYRPPTQPSS